MNELNQIEETKQTGSAESDLTLAGKYITFKLADEEYAFEILKVREIIGMMDVTRVPQAAPAVRGVINLRGKVNPVVDLRLKFEMSETVPTDQTVIVIVQLHSQKQVYTMGVLVDEVQEVLNVDAGDIEPRPNMGDFSNSNIEYIMGVAKVGKRVIFLLDIEKIFNTNEIAMGDNATSN
ncbi:MAG: chemotaxis protein CheW [Deltaproteobacteria bacterium]|nr:chemotaxis protein CheW [Deltaproteobacteria bacterium]MBN2671266.1 chemotaxis protein CheW [Deltaproteobacteria bacterium]